MPTFTFIDLFAGIGGFRLGLSKNGGECVGFSEIDKTAVSTYCQNYSESQDFNLGDITKIKKLPKHDFLVGGVPCQSWSIAGKNLGFDDDRGQLWNDTIYLLNSSRPECFIFENVKGLSDPRNSDSLKYILQRISDAGYFSKLLVLDSSDYGIPQSRVRVYIVGFKNKIYFDNFKPPKENKTKQKLFEFLDLDLKDQIRSKENIQIDLLGDDIQRLKPRFRRGQELNDFFLFNDIRNGTSTIHSWDIIPTTEREKSICTLLLKNRRKDIYGPFDGNPLSINHFKSLDSSISKKELSDLKNKGILKIVEYTYQVSQKNKVSLNSFEDVLLSHSRAGLLHLDDLKNSKPIKKAKFNFKKVLDDLKSKEIIECIEERYEFRYTKISSGINGINRIYLPTSEIFSTLVASDTNDFIATVNIVANSHAEFKDQFLSEIYLKKSYRKITKEEACSIQGFPRDFSLPEKRDKWMKLLGNSVSVPVVDQLCKAILKTGVFDKPVQSLVINQRLLAST